MTKRALSIGTTAVLAVSAIKGAYGDLLLVNNSANIVYVLDSPNQLTTDGIPVAANGGYYSDKFMDEDIYLIASGAASDVRMSLNYYPKEESRRISVRPM